MRTSTDQYSIRRPVARIATRMTIRVMASMLIAGTVISTGLSVQTNTTAYAHEGAHVPGDNGFVELAKRLSPAVVNISTAQNIEIKTQKYEKGSPLERFNDFFDRDGGNRVARSLGSGFVIDKSGYIVTNNHVIEGADEIEVAFPNGDSYEAKLIGRDPSTDLALLKIKTGKDMPFVNFAGANAAQVGEWVIAIGNPLGYSSSVATGIVSARNRNISMTNYDDFIQTDVAINKGNSGGPLFNMKGEVIGVNTAIVSPTGFSVGLSFSIPSDLAASIIAQLREFGETRRGYLGVNVQEITKDMARAHRLKTAYGALVRKVTEDSPASKAGLKRGDIILRLGGKKLEDSTKLARAIAEAEIGENLVIEILRKRKRKTLTVLVERLDEKVRKTDDEGKATISDKGDKPSAQTELGIMVEPIDADERRRLRLEDDMGGVRVGKVNASSDASGKLRKGDVVIEVGQKKVSTPKEFTQTLKEAAKDGDPVVILILRGGNPYFYTVKSSK